MSNDNQKMEHGGVRGGRGGYKDETQPCRPSKSWRTPFWWPTAKSFPSSEYAREVTGEGAWGTRRKINWCRNDDLAVM